MRSWSQGMPYKITQRDIQNTLALVANHTSETQTWMDYPNNINLSKTEIDANSIKIHFPPHSKTRSRQFFDQSVYAV
jgi:hypothetical protein